MSEKADDKPDTGNGSSPPEKTGDTAPPTPVGKVETPPKPPQTPAPASKAAPQPRSGSAVGWLALLLAVAVAAGGGWVVWQAMQHENSIAHRLDALEQRSGEDTVARTDLEASELRLKKIVAQGEDTAMQTLKQQSQELDSLREQVQRHAQLLDSFTANDQDSWLRAEAQYLLRLANQRLLMARDPKSAQALLESADNILQELDDPGLHEVRAAIASEVAALRAVPRVDVEGIYLRLSALSEQATKLKIFELPEAKERAQQEPADDWQGRLRRGYEQAVHKLLQLIIVRRRDVPMDALMDPQWEGLVRQNLRMLLEQAQVALLSGNQALYDASLERARHWVAQFFDSDEEAAQAMDLEIRQLRGLTVQVDLPDLSGSLHALDAAIRQQGGAG